MKEVVSKDEVRWNGAAMVFFALAFIACATLLATRSALGAIYTWNMLDLTVLGLATFRTTHLLTFDKIFEVVRARFMDKRGTELVKPKRGFRLMVSELLECIWCTGMWSALVIITLYLFNPITRLLVWMLAIAGIGTTLQVISKRIAAHM